MVSAPCLAWTGYDKFFNVGKKTVKSSHPTYFSSRNFHFEYKGGYIRTESIQHVSHWVTCEGIFRTGYFSCYKRTCHMGLRNRLLCEAHNFSVGPWLRNQPFVNLCMCVRVLKVTKIQLTTRSLGGCFHDYGTSLDRYRSEITLQESLSNFSLRCFAPLPSGAWCLSPLDACIAMEGDGGEVVLITKLGTIAAIADFIIKTQCAA